jgi:Na+/H+ antiporter NhaC
MPLAYPITPDPNYAALCLGGVLGGAVLGYLCRPISHTTILSCLAWGADVLYHFITQPPLALLAATRGGAAATLLAVFLI